MPKKNKKHLYDCDSVEETLGNYSVLEAAGGIAAGGLATTAAGLVMFPAMLITGDPDKVQKKMQSSIRFATEAGTKAPRLALKALGKFFKAMI